MNLKDAILNRRSIKIFGESTIDVDVVKQAINSAIYAPNHGVREPWHIKYVQKEQLEQYAEQIGDIAFKGDEQKKRNHASKLSMLGGILVVSVDRDVRQKQHHENLMAGGAFMQNLMLLLHAEAVGTCWHTPGYMFTPEYYQMMNISSDQEIIAELYLMDVNDDNSSERSNGYDDIVETWG